MPQSRYFMRMCTLFCMCCVLIVSSTHAFSQAKSPVQSLNAFDTYFNELARWQDAGSSKREAAYAKLLKSIRTMTPAEVTAGIAVIDRQLDNTDKSQNPWAKGQAVYLLRFIAFRPDGPELLASQMDRLASMLNDASHQLSTPALSVLQMIGYKRPERVWPILEDALNNPEVNNKTGIGPGIAIALLFMGPHGDEITEHVVRYMRRPDITEDQLFGVIMGINNSPVIPDILAAELVRALDRPEEHIKSRALVGIARSSPAARAAARTRLQNMANDPRETQDIRHLAVTSLERQTVGDSNPPNQ